MPTCGLAALAMAAGFRKCTTRLLPTSPTYSVSRLSKKIPNGPYNPAEVAKPLFEFQFGEVFVPFGCPTTPDAVPPASGRNSNEGNIKTRLLAVSDTYMFPALSTA